MRAHGFGALIHGCAVCDGPAATDLHCSRCGIMEYCSNEHLTAHVGKHMSACAAVAYAKEVLSEEETKLRNAVDPLDPFECYYGEFWNVETTRPFMLARMDLVKTLRRLRTRESVRQQLLHIRAMLDISANDDIMARIAAPALLLRMDEDQECYDLLKSWRLTGKACDYQWSGLGLGALKTSHEDSYSGDIFEAADYMCDHDPSLNDGTVLEHSVAMTLLKVKVLIDLGMLQKATIFDNTDVARRLPREVLDQIRSFLPQSTAVTGNRHVMELRDYTGLVSDLTHQIDCLYSVVKRMSDRFWPVMLDHYDHFEGRFRVHDRIGAAECPGGLRNSYDSWIETPGALDYLRAKIQGDPTSLKYIYLYG